MADDQLVIREYIPGDEIAINALFEVSFGIARTEATWRWRFRSCPEPTLFQIMELDGEVVGHNCVQRFASWVGGERLLVARGSDFMLDPALRGKGLFVDDVQAAFVDVFEDIELGLHFPADVSVTITARGPIGHGMLGRLPQWVAWTSVDAVRRSNAKAPRLVALAMVVAARVARRLPRRARVHEVRSLDGLEAEVDALAQRSATFAHCVRIRDAAYLRWRWLDRPDSSWRVLIARDGDRHLRGLVVLGADGDRGRIVDLLADDARSTSALVAEAARQLARDGATTITLELQDPRPWISGVLRRAGFTARGEGPHLMVLPLADRLGPEPGRLGGWYLTAGDSDLV